MEIKKIIFIVFFRVVIMKVFDDNMVFNLLLLFFVLRYLIWYKRLEELVFIDLNKI